MTRGVGKVPGVVVDRLRESGFIVKYPSAPVAIIGPVRGPGIEFFRRVRNVPLAMDAAAELSLASFASAFSMRRSSRPSLRVLGNELRRGDCAIADDHRGSAGLTLDSRT